MDSIKRDEAHAPPQGCSGWASVHFGGNLQLGGAGAALSIEEETNFHEQHRSPEHIHAMPAGSHAIHGFKAYTAASRHERTTWMVVDEASERRHLASRSMIGQRPDIREQDVWRNIGENLSRQPQKASALDMLHRMAETPPQVQRRIVRHGAARA